MALPATDPAARLIRLIGRAESRMRTALVNALLATRDQTSLAELARLIEAGRFQEAIDRAAMAGAIRVAEQYASVFVLAGQEGAEFLSDVLRIVVGFDQVNERAVAHMQRERLRLIREFTAEQRRATRAALVDGITRGLNPRDQARAFRQSIGLTERQQLAVQRYRSLLESGSSEALSRQLRDRRFDRTVARAARTGEPLTRAQVDRMVERYSDRYLRYRSEVIARTEALRAVHAGNDEMYRQAVESGHVAQEQLQRTWVTARDERVRHSHSALGGQTRGLDEVWEAAGGVLRYPGDPEAPASETVQCRCALATRIGRT
ncbi:hypothetical protein ELZ19_06725 [Brucella abortus]|uniref:phage minor head protein n=1 Tax=Brucella abortus TaxID=235 RepID=UPI0004E8E8C9|nr:phage minor head protein [Brucella abortus]KFH18427.1 hypothetical protein IB60_17105 [Brucella abortus LMN1]RUQ67343.1 hypothetical protein ELZ23_15560 [Brucella abortus]RUQ78153.1 hypothetical protein ELZ22_17315 [Brucella abortus]RUQ88270.1 hypothetical protein ELZ18_15520 [Brucella abortus]RUQ90299.1 hypothetical protein ELZ20_15515 [Brucella abortus]